MKLVAHVQGHSGFRAYPGVGLADVQAVTRSSRSADWHVILQIVAVRISRPREFTALQKSPRARFHLAPCLTLPQISPLPIFHPAPDFTPLQMSPRLRFHPAPDVTPPQISPRRRFHITPAFISMHSRLTSSADSASHWHLRAPRSHTLPDLTLCQKIPSAENDPPQKFGGGSLVGIL